jgi:hypothetical protein
MHSETLPEYGLFASTDPEYCSPDAAIPTGSAMLVGNQWHKLAQNSFAPTGSSRQISSSLCLYLPRPAFTRKLRLAEVDSLPQITPSQVANHAECFNPSPTAQDLCSQLHSTRIDQTNATNVSASAFLTAGILGVVTAATYLIWPAKKSRPGQSGKVDLGLAPLSVAMTQGIQFHSSF